MSATLFTATLAVLFPIALLLAPLLLGALEQRLLVVAPAVEDDPGLGAGPAQS